VKVFSVFDTLGAVFVVTYNRFPAHAAKSNFLGVAANSNVGATSGAENLAIIFGCKALLALLACLVHASYYIKQSGSELKSYGRPRRN
jgi:hypothetical protein